MRWKNALEFLLPLVGIKLGQSFPRRLSTVARKEHAKNKAVAAIKLQLVQTNNSIVHGRISTLSY